MGRLHTQSHLTMLGEAAVDHWDTDNPHRHVVLRGRAANGQDLVVASNYMTHGMRTRASEMATEWLGPRTELDIRQGLLQEVERERLTTLDRDLLRHATQDRVDLTLQPNDHSARLFFVPGRSGWKQWRWPNASARTTGTYLRACNRR